MGSITVVSSNASSITFAPPNTASHHRSERIPDRIWERYKPEIIREYRLGGSRGFVQAQRWIRDQHIPKFSPSPRQLQYRLNVIWGAKEEINGQDEMVKDLCETVEKNAERDPIPVRVLVGQNPTTASQDTQYLGQPTGAPHIVPEAIVLPVSASSRGTSKSLGMPEPVCNSPHSSELRSPCNVDEHTECRSKRKGPPIEESVDNLKKRHTQMRTWSPFESRSPSPFLTNSETTVGSAEDPSLSRINGSSSDQAGFISVTKEFSVSRSILPPVPLTTPTPMGSEAPQPKRWRWLLKARLGQMLNRIGLSLRPSDVCQLLPTNDLNSEYGPSAAAIAIIEDAANFLSGLFMFDQAFPLYFALLDKRKDISAEVIKTLTKCARSAARFEDVQLVQELVAAYQCQRATPGWSFPELLWLGITMASQEKPFNPSHKTFLATLLPSDAEAFQSQFQKGGNIVQDILESKIFDYEQMRKLFQGLGTWTSVEWERFFGDDLAVMRHVTRCCNGALELFELMYASRVSGQAISDAQWTDIHSLPQCTETCNGRVSIRSLAEWCSGKLAYASRLPKQWRTIRRRTIDRRWAESCAIYWYLWEQWEMQRHSRDVSSSTHWMDDLELTMGTSSAQLLSAMASLILKWSSDSRSMTRKLRPYLDLDTGLIQRATSGTTALLQQTDERLSKSFLGHFLDQKRTAEPRLLQSEMKTFQQAAAQIFLDTRRQTHSPREHLQLSPPDTASMSEDSLRSEIASTYTSSTMSSMRRITLKCMRASRRRSNSSWSNGTPSMDDLSESLNLMIFEGGASQPDSSHGPPEYT